MDTACSSTELVSQLLGSHMDASSPPYYSSNGPQVPTVLQPTYQPSPGPTASNDGGFYGPYWPDGKFVPYRPAAFRGQVSHYPTRETYIDRNLQNSAQTPRDLSSYRQSSSNLEFNPLLHNGNSAFHFQELGAAMIDRRFETPSRTHSLHIDTSMYFSTSEGAKTPTAQSVNKTSSHHFKEKTLSWAHSIYVDLLAFLHQSKKQSRNSSHTSKPHSRTSIYPKPPRQSTAYLGTSQWDGLSGGASDAIASNRHLGAVQRPPQSLDSSNNFGGWQGGNMGEMRQSRPSMNEIRQYVSPFQSRHNPAANALNKAKEALELLTNLCEQSNWCWIDGMLLGGCLAYGLEQYHDALEWYSKILALDSK